MGEYGLRFHVGGFGLCTELRRSELVVPAQFIDNAFDDELVDVGSRDFCVRRIRIGDLDFVSADRNLLAEDVRNLIQRQEVFTVERCFQLHVFQQGRLALSHRRVERHHDRFVAVNLAVFVKGESHLLGRSLILDAGEVGQNVVGNTRNDLFFICIAFCRGLGRALDRECQSDALVVVGQSIHRLFVGSDRNGEFAVLASLEARDGDRSRCRFCGAGGDHFL